MTRPAVTPQPPVGVMDLERAPLTIGLLLVVSTVAFEAIAVATALPAVADDLGRPALYGWAFSAFMLASLVSAVAAGRAADNRGPARPFLVGIACFTAGLAVAGLAPAMPIFVAARALQGAGAGCLSAMAYVSIGRAYPDALRARMMALLSSAWIVPGLLGPAVAGAITDHLSWRLVFLGLLPLPPLAAALTLPALRGMALAPADQTEPSRVPAALRLALSAGLVLAGIEAPSPLIAAPALIAGVALALPALRRLLPAGTLTARSGLPAGIAARGLLNFGYFGAEAFLPLALTSLHGWSTTEAGVALTVAALTWTAGSWIQARLDTRDGGRGRHARIAAGFALLVAGAMAMAIGVLAEPVPPALAVAGWGIAGVGMGIAYSTVSLVVLGQAPPGQEGAAASAMQVSELLSVALGVGLGNAAINLARTAGWPDRTGIGLAFAVAVMGAALGLLTTTRLRSRAGQPGQAPAMSPSDVTLSPSPAESSVIP